jgi:hypothetical protein
MKRGFGIIPFYYRLQFFLEILFLGGGVCVTLEREEEGMEANCTLNLVMENG